MSGYRRAVHLDSNKDAVRAANAAVAGETRGRRIRKDQFELRKKWMDAYIAAGGEYEVVKPRGRAPGKPAEPCPCKPISGIKILSLTFQSDHALLKDYSADWDDGGARYPKPEWTPAYQHPVSHTMDKPVELSVEIEVAPADACPETGTLRGVGPGGMVFEKTNAAFSPGRHTISLGSGRNLARKVETLNLPIQWEAKGVSVAISPNATVNKIYVTYGTPHGSGCTEKRLAYLCGICDGRSKLTQPSPPDEAGIAEAIYEAWKTPPPKFKLIGPNTPGDLWLLMSGTSYQGQCIDLATLMKKAVELLGGDATIGYVYGSTDTACYSTSPDDFETRTCPGGVHGEEVIRVWSAGGWNNWEAVCKVETICYAIQVYKGTPIEILKYWLGTNVLSGNYQGWRYYDASTSSWQLCTTPGPCPVPKP